MSKWLAALMVLGLIWGGGTAVFAAKSAPKPKGPPVDVRIKEARKDADRIRREMAKDKPDAKILDDLARLRANYQDMQRLPPPEGSADLFRQYCEAGAGIVSDAETQSRRAFWPAARTSFARLDEINDELSKEFTPSLGKRISEWFRRLFKGKSS